MILKPCLVSMVSNKVGCFSRLFMSSAVQPCKTTGPVTLHQVVHVQDRFWLMLVILTRHVPKVLPAWRYRRLDCHRNTYVRSQQNAILSLGFSMESTVSVYLSNSTTPKRSDPVPYSRNRCTFLFAAVCSIGENPWPQNRLSPRIKQTESWPINSHR